MSENLLPYIGRFRRRLRLRDGWLLVQRALPAGLLAAVLAALVGRLWPIPQPWLWVGLGALLPPLAAALYALLRPQPALRVAQRVDLELGLRERLSTALALEAPAASGHTRPAFPNALVARQAQDALSTAQGVQPGAAFPLHFLRRPWLLSGLLSVVLVVMAVLPNPMDAVRAERAAVRREAEHQAERIEQLREELAAAEELSPEQREELERLLDELAEALRANPSDLEESLAELSRAEETLQRQLNPNAAAQQSMLESLAEQLQAVAERQPQAGESQMEAAQRALEELAQQLGDMDQGERAATARQLSQMAARAAQAGDAALAQALAAMAQAAQSGDLQTAENSAQAASEAMASTEAELSDQEALEQALSQLQASRQALAQTGRMVRAQGPGQANAQMPGSQPGNQPGQGNQPGSSPGGQPGSQPGQGNQAGPGGGSLANQLPPGRRSGQAGAPRGEGSSAPLGQLDSQVFVPREQLQSANPDEMFIPGQDTGQGETQVRESTNPLPGAANPSLIPYTEVFGSYQTAANQALEDSYVPSSLKDYVREYFSQLEP